jgi:hypothetical protein
VERAPRVVDGFQQGHNAGRGPHVVARCQRVVLGRWWSISLTYSAAIQLKAAARLSPSPSSVDNSWVVFG